MEQRLTMIRDVVGKSADNHILAEYLCGCGNTTVVARSRVKSGYTKSCGCIGAEISRASLTTHGMKNTPEYRSWGAMLTRCCNPKSKDFPRYGGAGINVVPEWVNSFEAFFAHIGHRPNGTTLDRIDGTRGYEPGNVRWADAATQARNKKSVVHVRTPAGAMLLVDYARSIGITRGAAHLRLKRGTLEGVSHA